MEPGVLVELSHAGRRENGQWLVRDVSLSIQRGEIVTLIGPNGSGKSTTVKLALGIHRATSGSVKRARGLKVGYVPQSLAIDPSLPMTVWRLIRTSGEKNEDAIKEALAAAGIAHLGHADVHSLSGGEFQRALIARAIARAPDLLVLDEPVQGVDFSGEIALYELIASLRDRIGCAILLVSHDLHVVMAKTDRVLCLNGHVCCEGEPQSVSVSPEYRALFGPRGAETLAIYEHHHDHDHGLDGGVERLVHRPDGVGAHAHD